MSELIIIFTNIGAIPHTFHTVFHDAFSGAFSAVDANGKALTGANLTAKAFSIGLSGFGEYIVAIGIIFFALSTIISWSYYGNRAVEYLFGSKSVLPYRVVYCFLIPLGAATQLEIVRNISDIFNALMALPNLVGLILLSGVVVKMTREYFSDSTIVSNLKGVSIENS
ncbi:MAG: alanine or glycine:cation symporter, family [Tepidanaerobacteraceae bacterium]|nr:alanine or glycine:cation symporter, family [Tepidanaerobacteraceae bacterium]